MNIQWRWSTTTSRFFGQPAEAVIECCRFAGLTGLEGDETTYAQSSEAARAADAAAFRAAGLEMETFHLPFNASDNLSAFYESERCASVRYQRVWMENAARMGARIGILHPCNGRSGVAVEGLDRYLAPLEKSLKELLAAADELNLVLAIENMPPGRHCRLGSRPEHLARFREVFGHARLKFCLDTGHALISMRERWPEFFAVMGDDLAAVHLHDTPGDRDLHLAPGHGRIDWTAVFRGMARSNYRGSPVWRRFRSISGRPTPRNRGAPWCGRPMSGCVGRKRPDDATALLPSEGGLI